MAVFTVVSCVSLGQGSVTTEAQMRVVEAALSTLGEKRGSLTFRGREFTVDCSGYILGLYWDAGIDLAAEFPQYTGNGVTRIYKILRDRGLLHENPMPSPGDIIFWNHTWDRNGNGKFDDYLTHMGIVVDVDYDGTITYVHKDTVIGEVRKAKMNLYAPEDRSRNSYIRYEKKIKRTAGQLFGEFGSPWKL